MGGCILLTVTPTQSSWAQDLVGAKLYKPSVIICYLVLLGLPIALLLYGLNVFRRGERSAGGVICGISAATYVLEWVAFVAGSSPTVVGGVGGVFGALALYQLEAPSYLAASRAGTVSAKWWPPLILVVGSGLLAAAIKIALRPEL